MSIDWWTLGIETVNVAVLIWLLGRFFWRPVSAMIARRSAEATLLLDEAEARKAQAAAALADVQKTRDGFAVEREAILAKARDEAERQRSAMLDKARKDAEALQAQAQSTIESGRAAEEAEWAERSAKLAVEIAGRLMERLDWTRVEDVFADWLIAAILQLPDDVRKTAVNGSALEALSASPLDEERQAELRRRIGEAFGGAPQISFSTDRSLIAGFELRGSHLAIANSWKADLDRVLAEMTHGR